MKLHNAHCSKYTIAEYFGFFPQFIVIGTNDYHDKLLHALKSIPSPELDTDALNVFFRTGMFLDQKTPFKGIRRVLPDPEIVEAIDISYQEACETYIELFRQAIARCNLPRSIITLSGGRDSRHILLELHRIGQLPEIALTIDDGEEGLVASKLAKILGVRHRILSINQFMAATDEWHKNELCDFASLEHRWAMPIAYARGTLPLWDGIGGDVLSNGLFLTEWRHKCFVDNRLDELAESLVKKGKIMLADDPSVFNYEAAVIAVRQELERHKGAANPIGSFYFWNRTRVQIASSAFGLFRPLGNETTLTPYLDRDLWRFLSSLPASMLMDQSFHTRVIDMAYPKYSDIGYSGKTGSKTPAANDLRKVALSTLQFMLQYKEARSLSSFARIIRSIASPAHTLTILWILPMLIYNTQLKSLISRK